jgi:hypothetical protein
MLQTFSLAFSIWPSGLRIIASSDLDPVWLIVVEGIAHSASVQVKLIQRIKSFRAHVFRRHSAVTLPIANSFGPNRKRPGSPEELPPSTHCRIPEGGR